MLLLLFLKKRNIWVGAIYLVLVYFVSLLFSGYLILYENTKVYAGSIWSSLLFCILLTFYFAPYFKNSVRIKQSISPSFEKTFIIIGYALSFVLITGEVFLIPKIQEAFIYGLVESREAMYNDIEIFTQYTLTQHIGHSILRWLGGLSYSMILMFFYAITFIKKKYIFKTLLILSSTSAIFMGMLVGGRTAVIYWMLFFVFAVTLFWRNLDDKKKKTVKITTFSVGGLVLTYFILMTIARSSLANDYGGESSFFTKYVGQSYICFCDFIDNVNWHPYTFNRLMPLSHFALGERFDLTNYRDLIYTHTGKDIGVFYTLLGDLYVDLGYLGMFGYTIFYYVVAKRIMRKKLFDFSSILLVGVLYQIPLHGLFYYSLWSPECTFSIIVIICLSYYFKKISLQKTVDSCKNCHLVQTV